jgi:serine/threonine protein kinase
MSCPHGISDEIYQQLTELPFPPILDVRMIFDGYKIIRDMHASSRSHVYLAVDEETNATVVLKTPSIDLQGDAAYLERFLMEEWIARRINSAHVLKPCLLTRKRNYLYIVTEFVDGQTLTQWMIDNPKTDPGNCARDSRANCERFAGFSPDGNAAPDLRRKTS